MRACEIGAPDIVELLLHSETAVDQQDSEGKTALMKACEAGVPYIAELLLNKGALVDLQDNKGKTALVAACEIGAPLVVELLLKKGASVDIHDNEGKTALTVACEMRHRKSGVLNLLLMRACEEGEEDWVRLLLKFLLKSEELNLLLLRACEEGQEDWVRLLLKGEVDVNMKHDGKTLLMRVCEVGKLHIAELLINHGAIVDIQDDEGVTALMFACLKGNEECIKLLSESGPGINLQDNKGRTALMIACERKDKKGIEFLLRNKAHVNLQDHKGKTALMLSVSESLVSIDITKSLLNCGAQVHLQDKEGVTALMLTCQKGNEQCVKEILSKPRHGVNLQDNEGTTALMRACRRGTVNIARLLLSEEAMTPRHIGWVDIVELLLRKGALVNLQNNRGESALTITAEFCRSLPKFNVMSLLLKNGAHFDLQDGEGLATLCQDLQEKSIIEAAELLVKIGVKSSAHPHFMYDGKEIVKVPPLIEQLLSEGAEIESKDSKGRTALITASGNGHTMVTDLLLERGAHINSQDDQGYSALMSACQNGHIQTTSRLLDEDADTFLKNSEGKTAFDLAMENSNTELLPLFTKLRSKPSYPGIVFLEGAKRETVTTKEKTIDLEEVGISLSIPEDALPPTDPPLQLEIQPCFSGSFDVPPDIELVSPAYIVEPSRDTPFEKEVLVKMWHHANLESEEDCEDMVFLSASTSPEYRGDTPVYVFREIEGAKGSFRPGEEQPIGQIALKHFCTLALGKKRKREDDEQESDSEATEKKCKREDNEPAAESEEQELSKHENKLKDKRVETKHSQGLCLFAIILMYSKLLFVQAISTLQDCTKRLKRKSFSAYVCIIHNTSR